MRVAYAEGWMALGYVKLWRKSLDSEVWKDHNAWRVFTYVLMNVQWEPSTYPTKYGIIVLTAGQFVTGRHKMATETSLTERNIRTALKLLSALSIVTIKTTNRYSVITLEKWQQYQTDGKEMTSRATSKVTTVKEGRIEENTPVDFEAFWKAYPKKTGKGAALKAWSKNKPPLAACLEALAWQVRTEQWTKDQGQFIPHPTTWLNQSRWQDEPDKRITGPKRTAL